MVSPIMLMLLTAQPLSPEGVATNAKPLISSDKHQASYL